MKCNNCKWKKLSPYSECANGNACELYLDRFCLYPHKKCHICSKGLDVCLNELKEKISLLLDYQPAPAKLDEDNIRYILIKTDNLSYDMTAKLIVELHDKNTKTIDEGIAKALVAHQDELLEEK